MFLSSELSKISHSAGQMAFGWPGSFYDYLDLCQNSVDGDKWHPKTCYKKIHHISFNKLKSRVYDFLRDEFEHYLLSSWRGPLSTRSTTFSLETIQSHRWQPIKKVATSLGLAPSKLRVLLEKGLISSNSLRHSCGKISTVVDIKEAESFVVSVKRAQSLKDAAKELGVSERRVRSLVNDGLLIGYNSSNEYPTPWIIDCKDFINKLSPKKLNNDSGEYVTVRKVLIFHLKTENQFIDFVGALIKGEIGLFRGADDVSFADYKIIAHEYACWKKRWARDHQTVASFNAQEIASLLGVKDQVVYALINNGLLSHVVVNSQRRVEPATLKRFRERYVFNREIAQQFCVSPKMMVTHLSKKKFRPVAGPTVPSHPCRHYLWKRTKKLYDFLGSKFHYRTGSA
ncbi:helix-turn-helix domain-containing protein [Pseudomonas gingeri]|uniref:helix-turn-helix domain-containing protein n=1 Tax=Pseudomonas gingeri TaxID=117681 RepID=UPI002109FE0D|nr:helix-turn-helix domain-containing protein [Pseudomonas gingeri]